MIKATVFSAYMSNINSEVVKAQKECVLRCLPEGWTFKQVCHDTSHGEIMRKCVEENNEEVSVFLDIDCIPLNQISFTHFLDVRWSVQSDALVGAAQRANHLKNDAHIYVGPFCMAFKNSVYWKLGGPTFCESYRSDVGEELTYAWQGNNLPIYFFYPSDVEKPLWDLIENVSQFGIGTTYEDLFYHSFCIRSGGEPQERFLNKCAQVLKMYDNNEREKEVSTI